ncbi:hypothetical protein EYF80_053437 [Liparis tanakae]|uniref:Uncharacterized protein n=1 Tax=Liparis tanakae TaxID=230148 RepID=A0A4Z2F5A0_9TELE|nr:hypothetical protein EYF80_053437 [Liparis tanakae]
MGGAHPGDYIAAEHTRLTSGSAALGSFRKESFSILARSHEHEQPQFGVLHAHDFPRARVLAKPDSGAGLLDILMDMLVDMLVDILMDMLVDMLMDMLMDMMMDMLVDS